MQKGLKAMSEFVTKLMGVVFFSLLAIGLGVLFGYMFREILNESPEKGTVVQGDLENIPVEDTTAIPDNFIENPSAPSVQVKYRVLVGNYEERVQALSAAGKLQDEGYPVYVQNQPPYKVQVGAFASKANAEALKSELAAKGYEAQVAEY